MADPCDLKCDHLENAIPFNEPVVKPQISCKEHSQQIMNSMKVVIPLHSLYWSIHTKDESKRGTAFAFIFGVN